MANRNADVDLIATLDESSSEEEILKAIKILNGRLKGNGNAKIKLDSELDVKSVQKVIKKLETLLNSKNLSVNTKDSILSIQKEAEAMLEVVNSANKAAKEKIEFANANEKVEESAKHTSKAIEDERDAIHSLDDLDYVLNNINMQGRVGSSVFQQFGDTLRQAFYVFTAANLLQDAIYKVIEGGKEAVETVKELNDAATSLRMATGDSYSSVKQLMSDYNEMAQELGAITTDVSDAADAWLRQGHSVEDTNILIKDSMMLSKVSELEAADSTKYLTSAMQGYKVAVEDVVGIVDKLSAVDLESATDAAGLAEAMSRTAEGAQIAGISMDRLIGMIATTGEVTQKSMSSIGESYKTIFSRMRDIKDNKLSVIGDDGEIEDLSNVEIVLNSLGIKLRDSNLEFRNFQDVLDDVANSWDSYTSVQQAAIAKAFSGVRQQENFLVMMENWDKVVEYTNIAANSAGTAEEKFGYYLESLEAKTNSLKASLENLATTTISDELYASVLDTTKAIVDATTETGILKGAIAGLGTAGALYTFQHLATYLRNATQEFANLGEAMQITRNSTGTITDIQRLIDLTGGLSQSQTRLLLSTNNLTDAQKVAILMNQGLTRAEAQQTIQTWGVASAQQGATSATITFSSALRGLFSTLMANPLILISTAITIGVTAFNKYKQAQEEAIRSAKEAAEEANALGDEIADLANKYIVLSEAVKTDESAKEDLMTIQTELLKKLGLEGESIDDLIAKYGSLSNAIRQVSIDSLKNSQIDLIAGVDAAREELLDIAKDNIIGNNNIISVAGDDAVRAFKELEKAGVVNSGSYGTGGGQLVLLGDDTVEGALENFNRLENALETLRDSEQFTAEELSNNSLYQAIYGRYNEMKDEVEAYTSAIDNLNENLSQQIMLIALQGRELPKTQQDFEIFKQELIDTAVASKQFIGDEKKIADAVNNYLSTVSQFADYYNIPLENESLSAITINFDSTSFLESVSAIQSGYEKLLSAQEEFNEYGAITASTLKDLMDNDLIQYLQFTADGLSINTQALEDNEQALKDAATAELYNAMCNDIQNLSLGDTVSLSDIAQTAIANLDSAATTAGENAAIAAQGWWEYGASIQSIPGIADLTGDNYKKALAIVDQYKNIANSINSLSIGNTNSTKKSSSSSTKDTWKEAFQAEYDTLKHNIEMEYITEEQYYNSLNALNQKYFAGKSEYLDEYRKYEEEVYKGLKSIYKDYVDSYLSYMKQSLESSRIDYKTYSSDVAKFLKDMYDQGKIAAKDYFDYTQEMLEVQKDAMDGVISAVVNRLDKEIDSYEDQIDEVEKRYQTEIDYLDTVIKYYEDQKKALQDSNDELDRQKALEEALYNLKRAQDQRTIGLYTADKGKIYTTDTSAIRDAEEEVRQSKLDIEIAKLDEAIDKLEQQQDALQDAMDREKEQLQEVIDRLEDYKDQWNSISDEYENAQKEMYANGILGLGWQTEILNGNQNILNNFKDNYISIQQAISDAAWESTKSQIAASEEAVQGIADIKGIGDALDEATNSLRDYNAEAENISQEPYNSIIGGAQDASNAIGGDGQGGYDISYDDMKAETVARQKSAKNTSSSGGGSLIGSVNSLETAEGSAQQSSKALMDEISNGAGVAKGQVDGIKSSVEELDGAHAEVTIDIKVNGSVPNLSGLSGGGKGSSVNTMQKYGTGTKNAEPGVHTVAENGTEIIRDNYGNAYVAEGEQLHYFEGGETVIKASESEKILANMDNLIPLQDYVSKLSPIDYSSMVMSNLNIPDFSKLAVNRGESTTISIGDIHLHEVQNPPDFAKALNKYLPNISVQYNGRH